MKIDSVDHLVVNVTNVEQSAAWYARVLGMERLDYGHSPDRMRTAMVFGRQKINLRPMTESQEGWLTAEHAASGSDDLCFLTTSAPEQVVEHLTACGVEIISGPETRSGALGPIASVYCRDPDGSLIEISSYYSG
jgi:catechol 2,3-dioxygenase-like lactoylglutathione lyase family enzyme